MIEAHPLDGNTPPPGNGKVEILEQRLHRLENAVEALQDTRQLEERLVERVADRMSRNPPRALVEASGVLIEAKRRRMPAKYGSTRSSEGGLPEALPVAAPPPRQPWFVFEALADIKAMLRMFIDPHYRPARFSLLMTMILLTAIFTSWLWVPGTALLGIIGTGLDKVVDLVLALFLYKILSREARRYRASFPN
jgi:hypothetical protein